MAANPKWLKTGRIPAAVYAALGLYRRPQFAGSECKVGKQTNRWFALMLSDCVTQKEHERFRQWLDEDHQHSEQYHQLCELWDMIACYADEPEVRIACKNANEAICKKRDWVNG